MLNRTTIKLVAGAAIFTCAASAAFAQGENMDDPITMYLNDVFTVPSNLSGVPASSVPAGLDANGLPLGLQVIGKPFDEETVFAVSAEIERAARFTALPALRARRSLCHHVPYQTIRLSNTSANKPNVFALA